jgi:hypothetical protein
MSLLVTEARSDSHHIDASAFKGIEDNSAASDIKACRV